jgi:hypothetical protein
MAIVRGVSLNKEQDNFLNENPELSISKITQVAINNLMESHQSISKEHLILKKRCGFLETQLQNANEQIAKWEEKRF